MDTWWKSAFTNPVINYLGKRKEYKVFSKAPIFIGGCGRSGTTLLLAMLSAHPNIYAFPHEVDAFTSWISKDGKLVPKRMDRLYRYILTHKIPISCHRWLEKRPSNIHHVKSILEYYGPHARFIHIVRDPRAVCTSIHPKDPENYWISIDRWVKDVSAGLVFEAHPQMLTIKFENLINDASQLLSGICEFINEPYFVELQDWFRYATVRRNKAWKDGLKKIQTTSLDKWQDHKHKDRIDEIESDKGVIRLMKKLDYS